MQLSNEFFIALPKNIEPDKTKHFIIFKDELGKKVCFSGKRVQLLEYNLEFGTNFIEVTEEQARFKHLGKMRCIGSVSNEYELLLLFSKYFKFEVPTFYKPIIALEKINLKSKKKERQKKEHKKKNLDVKIDQLPKDRDEKELIIAFRNTNDKRKQDKIFNTILFKRGVNGKTWDQIIKNYVSYNKVRFAQFKDRTENDFYQDIVIALHKQISKWFNVEEKVCFSTYAWFVINCAFNRILQLLSTKKRKSSLVKIELDDPNTSWDETISMEKTNMCHNSFEDNFIKKNLCDYIQRMFDLKEIDAPEELKQEMLKVIREKSTMKNSLYSLAKKYNLNIEKVFLLEKDLRDNLKNSMFSDIIRNFKYDINGDDFIADKYKRSKGHIIKMKRQVSLVIKSKLKETSK